MKKGLLVFLTIVFLSFNTSLGVSAYYTNMSASIVIGQNDLTSNSSGTSQNTLFGPAGVFIDTKGRLIVTELNNHRVLVWNTVPTRNGVAADLVLGQLDFVSGLANRGGSIAANTLNGPQAAYSDGVRLLVADSGNNRVLIWNMFPTANGQEADVVVGSSFMNGGGTGCAQDRFAFPTGVSIYNGKLLVSDSNNRRVMIFNSVPTTNGATADVVLGQTSFTTCSVQGATSTSTTVAKGLWVDKQGRLFVTDDSNRRVMIWNSIPTTNNQAADVVVGQPDFTTSTSGTTASKLSTSLRGIYSSGGRLFIPDQGNHRLLIFNSVPTSNGASADLVLGQSDFTSGSANQGGSTSASGFNNSGRVFEYNNDLYVSDYSNNRILIFPNTLSTPQLGISTTETLADSRLRIKGTVEVGERGRYSLSSVVASVNGLGYGNVTSKDNGRDNGDGKTLYEFTHEFEPWVNNNGDRNTWRDKGYTVALKAISSNAEEDEVLLFSPFVLKAIPKDSSSLEFSVPTAHWSTLTDKLSGYRIEVKRKTDKEWGTLTTISPSHSNNTTVSGSTTNPTYTSTLPSSSLTPLSKSLKINTVTSSYTPSTGEIKVKVDTTLPSGEYRIQAVSKTGSTFSSNTISHTSSTTSYLPSLTLTTSWFPLQINKITGTNLSILSSFSTYTPKPLTSSTTTPTVSGIAPSYSTVYLQVTNSSTPTQKKLYKTTTTSNTSFSIPISLYPKSTLDTWVTNTHNTTVLSPIALTANTNNSVLKQYLPKSMDKTNEVLY